MSMRAFAVQIRLIALACASLGADVDAQTVIPDKPNCPTCRISIKNLITIGDAEGPGALTGQPLYTRVDSKGRFWLTDGTIPQIFDPDGRFLTMAGRRGRGPGEFIRGIPMASAGDSMVVLDAALGRAVIMTADKSGVRTVSMPPGLASGIVIRWPDIVVHSGSVATPERIGYTLHRASYAGSSVVLSTSTSPIDDEVRPGDAEPPNLLSPAAADGTFWTSEARVYRFAQWDHNLRKLKLFERQPTSWPRKLERAPTVSTPTHAPDPYVAAVSTDESGLVWVFLRVAADDWQEAWPKEVRGRDLSGEWLEANAGKVEFHKLRSTLVEVIDPSEGVVVTRQELQQALIAVLPGLRGVLYTPKDDGTPQVTVIQFTLARR
jgi:hypothetical protein